MAEKFVFTKKMVIFYISAAIAGIAIMLIRQYSRNGVITANEIISVIVSVIVFAVILFIFYKRSKKNENKE